jgi:beta-glucosidase
MAKSLKNAPFRNPDLPLEERIDDLIARLPLAVKASQLLYNSPAVPSLGIPEYNWWNECLHGVARAGRATVFPQAIGLGATFDRDLAKRIAEAIALEGRAKHHAAVRAGNRGQYRGLTFWTPNINIFRDPRWGRGHETYGEDPHLTAELGTAFVQGLQGDDPKYLKAAACAKHYAVHSGPEGKRHEFDARVSEQDLFETYLPAFEALAKAGVESVMGAYNRVNGEPCNGSRRLLADILRRQWGFKGHVVSDCWAINDFHGGHQVTKSAAESAAMAIKAGCDLNCGNAYLHLLDAVDQGLLAEADIDLALRRLLRTRFRLGLFDPPKRVPFAAAKPAAIACPKHRALAREAARKSLVLLKNNNGVLPLRSDHGKIYVTGVNAASIDALLGNYYGINDRLVTVLEGIVGRAPEGTTVEYRLGCLLDQETRNPIDWATGEAKGADVTVAVLGLTGMFEGEEGESLLTAAQGDKETLDLPACQLEFLRKLREAGKPLVLVLTGGSPVIVPDDLADAILWIWYPGQEGGTAVADVLFGDQAPAGRLPVTFPRSLDQLPPFTDYAIAKAGRTYRYMTGEPQYPFGFGLSYTTFAYNELRLSTETVKADEGIVASVTVANVGDRDAEEVVQLYLCGQEQAGGPRQKLVGFRRVAIPVGTSATVSFPVTPAQLAVIDERGKPVAVPGRYRLVAAGACPIPRSEALGAPMPVSANFAIS